MGVLTLLSHLRSLISYILSSTVLKDLIHVKLDVVKAITYPVEAFGIINLEIA